MNCVTAVCGNIQTKEQIEEFGFFNYDCIVIGRGILQVSYGCDYAAVICTVLHWLI